MMRKEIRQIIDCIGNQDNTPEISLEVIKNNDQYQILLTSRTPPLKERTAISQLLSEGEEYMKRLDAAVKECYSDEFSGAMDSCKATVEKLGLPPFLVNPIVDKAFRSHIA